MTKDIETIKKIRIFLLGVVQNISTEDLNKVPPGFNNNIIWNLGHLIAAQQGVCYLRAGLKPVVEEQIMLHYKPETKPEKFVEVTEIDKIKELLIESIDKLEIDYNNHVFEQYKPWNNRYNVQLNNIDEAIRFISFHEGFHLGYVMALKHVLI